MRIKMLLVSLLIVVSTILQAMNALKIEKVVARKDVQMNKVSYEIH